MADIQYLQKLARRITGRSVPVVRDGASATDGKVIFLSDPDAIAAGASKAVLEDLDLTSLAHEAWHIVLFDREAKKRGVATLTAEDFYRFFADPLSPGADSKAFVRVMLNLVDDQLVDLNAAKEKEIGQERMDKTNQLLVWRRQGGSRKPITVLEGLGSEGQCAAFIEAVFQLSVYGKLIEPYVSEKLLQAAQTAFAAMFLFTQGALSRSQALERVLQALAMYCPPPWKLPPTYQPPKSGGQGQGQGQGQGNGDGKGDGDGEGKGSGEGQGQGDGKGDGDGEGKGSGEGQGQGQGKPSTSDKVAKDGKPGKPSKSPESGESGLAKLKDKEEGSESKGQGQGSPQDSENRGEGTGEAAGDGKLVGHVYETDDDRRLDDLIRTLKKIISQRANKNGRGMPSWQTWSPGDQISAPDERQRYQEDETYGIAPMERRCVSRRQIKKHLVAVFIDSSGSVSDELFAKLYGALAELAESIIEIDGCYFGVGQFSGGACWVLEPTRNPTEIQALAAQEPKRLYSGSTTVGEIYKLLPVSFSGYKTADLIVLTEGYVEKGEQLAKSVEESHVETGCEIKLHGIVFQKHGIVSNFNKARRELPQHIRVWHLD